MTLEQTNTNLMRIMQDRECVYLLKLLLHIINTIWYDLAYPNRKKKTQVKTHKKANKPTVIQLINVNILLKTPINHAKHKYII